MLRPDVPVLPRASARPALTGTPVDFTEAWLLTVGYRRTPATRTGATSPAGSTWCAAGDLDPLRANFLDVNAYARQLEATLRRAAAGR